MISTLKSMRYDMFPEIKDWSSEQNKLRNSHPNDLDFSHFVWFHPLAYTLMRMGLPINFIIWSLVLLIKSAKYGINTWTIIWAACLILTLVWLFREINKIDVYMKINMYDIMLKD